MDPATISAFATPAIALAAIVWIIVSGRKKNADGTSTVDGIKADASDKLAKLKEIFSGLGIVQDAKAMGDDLECAGTLLGLAVIGRKVAELAPAEKQAEVATHVTALLNIVSEAAAPAAK